MEAVTWIVPYLGKVAVISTGDASALQEALAASILPGPAQKTILEAIDRKVVGFGQTANSIPYHIIPHH